MYVFSCYLCMFVLHTFSSYECICLIEYGIIKFIIIIYLLKVVICMCLFIINLIYVKKQFNKLVLFLKSIS
jgi:hypothetical protein